MSPTTWTEGTAAGASWTQGIPDPGSTPVHILFGAIILNQRTFSAPAATAFTEDTVTSGTMTESTVNSTAWTETAL